MDLKEFFKKYLPTFSLDSELEDSDFVYNEIKKGIIFRGTNLWILIFAIIVASVGLNMNSTAVVIGAMLISPLMGPINGMGYSIATYDFELFIKSIKNYGFAIISSLVASTLYFALSPVSTAHSELLARTSPTIYDVLIALFGGFAGIIAICSKQKGNVIPGVAIATALMPPLCTAGYGIATLQFNFFLGAFYLFTINTIFIAFASVWISKLLKFPIRTLVDEGKKKKIRNMITVVITIVLLPSIYFGYRLVKQEDFLQKANQYISNVTLFEGQYLLEHKINAKKGTISLVYGGSTLSENQKNAIVKKAADFKLENAKIIVEQGLTLNTLEAENSELLKLKEQVFALSNMLEESNSQLDSIKSKPKIGLDILDEIKTLFPEVNSCYYAESINYKGNNDRSSLIPVVILTSNNPIPESDMDKINNWIKKRIKNNKAKIYYELN